jgi:hypothetical protein
MLKGGQKNMKWVGGLAEWQDHDTVYLSVAFTWKIPEAIDRAVYHSHFFGRKVVAGGPALFQTQMRRLIEPVAEYQEDFPDAVTYHNPQATFASRGCDVGCSFCIVPAMEGKTFTLLPEFPVRPILCDNNLSALPIEYQRHIVARYKAAGVPLLDANSGFEPKTFTPDVLELWRQINRGPWRFAFDESGEREDVHRCLKMLKGVPGKKRVYVLIGNEPFDACMQRIREVVELGGEPHVQPVMRLNALEKLPWVRYDWTVQRLRDVARWANGFAYKRAPFKEYNRNFHRQKTSVPETLFNPL